MAEPCDVVIIGAGAAGGVAGLHLVTRGLDVVCFEQGDWPDRASYRGAEDDWELTARKQWSSSPNIRQGLDDHPVDDSAADTGVSNYNAVGGGMILYGGIWPRLTADDFRVRSVDGVADDWPISYADLLPYYEETDRQFGVSGLGGNPAYPPGADPPLPALPIGPAGLKVARAHARLGWHWWPDSNAILSVEHDGRHPCVQRGSCLQGCGEGAKASSDLTHWPKFEQRGGTLHTGARVVRITLDHRGLANGVEWMDRDGVVRFQPTNAVLCAANGVGTARLLLSSSTPRFSAGLANGSGLVGKRLMMHSFVTSFGLFEENLHSWQGHTGGAIQSMEFYATDADRGFVRGAKWCLEPTGGPLGMALAGDQVFGAEHHRHLRERFGHTARWSIACEDLPHETNRVELSTTATDRMGLAVPQVTYRFDENIRRMQRWHAEKACESLLEAGAWKAEHFQQRRSGHLLGTARMGSDPETSVVDEWCMSHDIANLGIIDGSVFVTAGGVNPTSTIAAIALRAAEHLADGFGFLPRPAHGTSYPVSDHTVTNPAHPPVTGPPGRTAGELNAAMRARLADLADVLIPGDESMPSARAAGVAGDLLGRVLEIRPDLASRLHQVLGVAFSDPTLRLEEIRTTDPPGYQDLLTVVAGGYYLDRDVRRALGYPGQQALPISVGGFPAYLAEGLLDHLVDA